MILGFKCKNNKINRRFSKSTDIPYRRIVSLKASRRGKKNRAKLGIISKSTLNYGAKRSIIVSEVYMRIGIITAMAEETVPILAKLGGVVAEDSVSGVAIKQIETGKHTVYLATSGIGEIRAALAVQLLVDLFDIEAVLNFGFVGSLNKSIPVGELVLVDRAVHYQFDIGAVDGLPAGCYDGKDDPYFYTDRELMSKVQNALPHPLRTVTAASGDVFVADSALKNRLRDTFFGDICEMEIAGICLAAERNHIPVFSMKVVSDGADEEATVSFGEVLEKGLSKYEHLLPVVLEVMGGAENRAKPPVKV